MSCKDENEIISKLHEEIEKVFKLTNKAIVAEDASRYGDAMVQYGRAMIALYGSLCFLSGVVFRKTAVKGSSTSVNFSRAFLTEKIINKIVQIYVRVQRLENVINSGNSETYSLIESIKIPKDLMSDQTTDSTNDLIKDVLVQIEPRSEIDTFENIIGHQFTKEKLFALSHMFLLNVNENTKNILQNRHVSPNMMIILYGEPGTGKTSLVKALAHRLNVKLYELKLSALYNKYVGESEKTMSALFDWILSSSEPKIVFIDELDSLFGKRGAGNEESLDKKLKIIFMTEMNRFSVDSRSNTLIIGATNLIDDIDEAIRRRSVLNIKVGKPTSVEEYLSLIEREFFKLKLNVEPGLSELIANEALGKNWSQSKIVDVVKKLFSFVTARLSSEIRVRKFRDRSTYHSLNGTILGPDDDKYVIEDESVQSYDTENVTLDSDRGMEMAYKIVLPPVTVESWKQNKNALL